MAAGSPNGAFKLKLKEAQQYDAKAYHQLYRRSYLEKFIIIHGHRYYFTVVPG